MVTEALLEETEEEASEEEEAEILEETVDVAVAVSETVAASGAGVVVAQGTAVVETNAASARRSITKVYFNLRTDETDLFLSAVSQKDCYGQFRSCCHLNQNP